MDLHYWTGRGVNGDIQAGMRAELVKLKKGDGLVYFEGATLPHMSAAGAAAWNLGRGKLATLVQKQTLPASVIGRKALYILQRK